MSSLAASVVGTTDDLFPPVAEVPEPEPEPTPEPEAEPLDLAPAADLTDLFGDEDFEIDDEPTSAFDELGEDELRAELVKTQRKAEHERALRVQTGQKAWRAESEKKFPYSQPEQIRAESRRDFLRQAQERDAAFRAQAQPLLDGFKRREAQMRATVEAEVRAEFEAGWGTPTLGGGPGAPPAGASAAANLDAARKKRSLFGATKALMDGGNI